MPDRFIPLSAGTDINQVLAILNKNFGELDNESITKVFRGPNGKTAIIEGKLPYDGGYGALYYDKDGIARILIGIDPDGGIGLYVSKPGEDVVQAFN